MYGDDVNTVAHSALLFLGRGRLNFGGGEKDLIASSIAEIPGSGIVAVGPGVAAAAAGTAAAGSAAAGALAAGTAAAVVAAAGTAAAGAVAAGTAAAVVAAAAAGAVAAGTASAVVAAAGTAVAGTAAAGTAAAGTAMAGTAAAGTAAAGTAAAGTAAAGTAAAAAGSGSSVTSAPKKSASPTHAKTGDSLVLGRTSGKGLSKQLCHMKECDAVAGIGYHPAVGRCVVVGLQRFEICCILWVQWGGNVMRWIPCSTAKVIASSDL